MDFKTVAIIGGSARNKGALLMLDSTIKLLIQKKIKKVYIFTPFLNEDMPFFEQYKNLFKELEVINWSQRNIVLSFVLSIFKIKKTKINKALYTSTHVIDISGISFVSSRGYKHFIYNCISIFLPSMFECRIIKFPQSFGPVNGIIHKKIANFALKKCDYIFSRGLESKKTLDSININSVLTPDLGFLAKNNYSENNRTHIGIQPSIVVKKYFTEKSIDYEKFLTSLIVNLRDRGYELIVFPQAFYVKDTNDLFNDTLIIKNLENTITNNENINFINKDLTLDELYSIYSKLTTCITSRFHGMIMSLTSGVLPLVVGWNHKYQEVLEDFRLSDLSFDIEQDLNEKILNKFEEIQENISSISGDIFKHLNSYNGEKDKLLNSLD